MDEELAYLVLSVVEEIPAGRVATYGQLARLIGRERNARLVARVLSHAQEYGSFPCHRVVDRFGGTKAAFDTFAPGTQRALLEAEGVAFRLDGTVDLEQCLWTPES